MSLNCLACHTLQRSDSDNRDMGSSKSSKFKENYAISGYEKMVRNRDMGSSKASNFTENYATSGYEKMVRNRSMLPAVRRVKKGHRRMYSADVMIYGGTDEPKLIRSSGIRRDWSFEDLKKQREMRIEEIVKE